MIQPIKNPLVEYCRRYRYDRPDEVIDKGLKEIERLLLGSADSMQTIAWLYYYVGTAFRYKGDYAQAILNYNRALNYLRYFEDKLLWADVNTSIASIAVERGDYEAAISTVEVVIPIYRHAKRSDKLASSLQTLAVAQYELGRIEKSLDTLYVCERITEADGRLAKMHAQVLVTIGCALYDLERLDESEEYLLKALRFSLLKDDLLGVANSKCELSRLYRLTESWSDALRMAEESRVGFRDLGLKAYEVASLVYLGDVYGFKESPYYDETSSEGFYLHALHQAEECQYSDWILTCHTSLANFYEQNRRFEESIVHLRKRDEVRSRAYSEATLRRVEHLEVTLEVEKERRKSEVELAKNKLLQEKNHQLQTLINEKKEFMALAAHDLKNPLSGIIGLVDYLKHHEGVSEVDEVPAVIDLLAHSADNAMSIVRNLLEDHRLEEGQVEPDLKKVDLSCICEHVRMNFERRAGVKGIGLTCDCNARGMFAEVDEFMIQQVLDNLVSNAIKFCKQGDEVQVKLKRIPERNTIELRVEDSGPGISVEDQGKLFQRFAKLGNRPTGNEGSSGLGLSIVKKLVELNQGEIRCESEFGSGSTFVVILKAYLEEG